jgi:hypothetical protein
MGPVAHTDIAELYDMLQRLRAADTTLRVFGARQHRYALGPTLPDGELAAFESANGIRLPNDYRRFLGQLGNGGAGPFYGLERLDAYGQDLSRPFPFTTPTDAFGDEELERLLDGCAAYPGLLEVCHHGSGIFSSLVVNGPAYGTIWDGREDYYPTHLTFLIWYRRWLERALRVLDNERLVPRLRLGMTPAQVLAEVGGDWKERPALGRPLRYFEADEIPAQLLLDERDLVVEVNPWAFI